MSAIDTIISATQRWWFGPAGKHDQATSDKLAAEQFVRDCGSRAGNEARAKRNAAWDAMTPQQRAAHLGAVLAIAKAKA